MKHVTIKEVAKALNCSISTVSRAFNNKYDIRQETREKVLKVAKKMGYIPNPIAQKLTKKQTFNIGVVIPEFINSFFPEVIIGMQEVFIKKGYQVLIMQSNEDFEVELENLKTLVDKFVDGILISLTNESKNIQFLEKLIDKEYPLVLFNRSKESLSVSKVIFDDYKWSMFATEHLIEQGITDLIYLRGPYHLTLSKNRCNGFRDALKKHKLPIYKEKIIESGFFRKNSVEIVEKLIAEDKLPKGFVCVNDPTAIGVIEVLKRNGYKIPNDVAVIGFTESPMASLIDPPLSSVVQPAHLIGEVAAELLLKQIELNTLIPETVVLSGRLNIRESSVLK